MGVITRIKNIHRLDQDYTYQHPALAGIQFRNGWCAISDSRLTVAAGYAWDGCSPKWDLAGLAVVGVPDGRQHLGRPITYYPSLVHDVFCQFRNEIKITKQQTIQILSDMLKERKFGARWLYVTAVDWKGPQQFAGDMQHRGDAV